MLRDLCDLDYAEIADVARHPARHGALAHRPRPGAARPPPRPGEPARRARASNLSRRTPHHAMTDPHDFDELASAHLDGATSPEEAALVDGRPRAPGAGGGAAARCATRCGEVPAVDAVRPRRGDRRRPGRLRRGRRAERADAAAGRPARARGAGSRRRPCGCSSAAAVVALLALLVPLLAGIDGGDDDEATLRRPPATRSRAPATPAPTATRRSAPEAATDDGAVGDAPPPTRALGTYADLDALADAVAAGELDSSAVEHADPACAAARRSSARPPRRRARRVGTAVVAGEPVVVWLSVTPDGPTRAHRAARRRLRACSTSASSSAVRPAARRAGRRCGGTPTAAASAADTHTSALHRLDALGRVDPPRPRDPGEGQRRRDRRDRRRGATARRRPPPRRSTSPNSGPATHGSVPVNSYSPRISAPRAAAAAPSTRPRSARQVMGRSRYRRRQGHRGAASRLLGHVGRPPSRPARGPAAAAGAPGPGGRHHRLARPGRRHDRARRAGRPRQDHGPGDHRRPLGRWPGCSS